MSHTETPATDPAQLDPEQLVARLMATPTPADPQPYYDELRRRAPVHRSAALGMTFVTRYRDAKAVLRSPAFRMVGAGLAASDPRFAGSEWLQSIQKFLVFTNPPQHTRIRGVLNKAFTPKVVDDLRPRIAELVAGHLDRAAEMNAFDLVAELASPLPCQVICELFGLPAVDHAMVRRWSDDIAATVQPAVADDVLAQADRTVTDFRAYLRGVVDQRRRRPGSDLLSRLMRAQDEEGRIDEDELLNFAISLLAAGTETTTTLLAVGTLALLQNPRQLGLLREKPELAGRLVEELLRFESPVQMAFVRMAGEDVTAGDVDYRAGEVVGVLLGAANHDPEVFERPHDLDLLRDSPHPPLSFGFGAHFCIGAALARAEGEIALSALLLERFPHLRVVDEAPPWREAFTLRGVTSLMVAA
jgi:pimeloyl-[acyl-carrier protein] synthase